ncbi:MAG: XRE family transcriptional regulator [Hyphomicrobium sp.]|uniref:helix-turn-helix domain-containing protein n=1 Tax=Hyphomicrobium sp. TaxID=82 RepID=UPI0039E41282
MARKEDNPQLRAAVSGPAKLSMVVGENLRHLRRRQGLSLEQLSSISGVSRAMLGQIETGKSAPTINLLGRIAEALKVSVAGLISSPGAGGTIVVPRDRATIVASGEGGFVSRALFPWGDPQNVEIYELTVDPHHSEGFDASAAGTKKNLVVISGELEVTVGEDTPARLCTGDAILFNADATHRFLNPSDKEAKAFLVITVFDGPHSRGRQI